MKKELFMQEIKSNYENNMIDNADLMYYVKRNIITLDEARSIIKENGGDIVYGYYKE